MILFFVCLLITVFFHELAHMLTALLFKVKVEAFSVGFGKPYLHKKIKGIDFRLSPILLGGYTQLGGEYSKKRKTDFLSQRYYKKFIILVSGALVNLLIALICYKVNYNNILFGIEVDTVFLTATITKNYDKLFNIIYILNPNLFLLQLGLLNFFCGIFNLLPFPALDGGMIWLVWLEKLYPKNFEKIIKKVSYLGFIILMILQVFIVIYIFKR